MTKLSTSRHLSIYVPRELAKEMKSFSYITNWSSICQKAIEAHLEELKSRSPRTNSILTLTRTRESDLDT